MRAALIALTDELKRLKTTGVTSVSVAPESLAALRKAVQARAAKALAVAVGYPVDVTAERVVGPAKSTAPVPARDSAPSSLPIKTPVASGLTALSTPATAPTSAKPEAVPLLPPPPHITLPDGDKATRWAWLRDQALNHPVCLSQVRPGKKGVFGGGSLDARIVFVGDEPSADDETQGACFVGPAGDLLTKMVGAMGLKPADIYSTNLMTWRTQTPTVAGVEQLNSRELTAEEMAFCLPFLRAQIEIVNPAIIVVLGATAARGMLGAGSFKSLPEVRGQWRSFLGKPLIVTYHPNYLLRQEKAGDTAARKAKRATWEDLLKVMEQAGLTITAKQHAYFLDK